MQVVKRSFLQLAARQLGQNGVQYSFRRGSDSPVGALCLRYKALTAASSQGFVLGDRTRVLSVLGGWRSSSERG